MDRVNSPVSSPLPPRDVPHTEEAPYPPVLGALPEHCPDTLGSYRPIGTIGSGGTGRVYLAVGPNGEEVALKVLHRHLYDDDVARARLSREVELAASIDSATAINVIDAQTDGPDPWVAIEYVPGPTLDQLVAQRGPLNADELTSLGLSLLEAISGVHRANVIHRDIKPNNVIVSADGPRLIDLGIALDVAGGDTRLTNTGMAIGTPSYIAPELIEAKEPSVAADLFGWGATMYFAATGTDPFGQGHAAAVLHRVLHVDPDMARVPEELQGVIAGALEKDAGSRLTVEEVLHLLEPAAPIADLSALAQERSTDLYLPVAQLEPWKNRRAPQARKRSGSAGLSTSSQNEIDDTGRRRRGWLFLPAAAVLLVLAGFAAVNLVNGDNSPGADSTVLATGSDESGSDDAGSNDGGSEDGEAEEPDSASPEGDGEQIGGTSQTTTEKTPETGEDRSTGTTQQPEATSPTTQQPSEPDGETPGREETPSETTTPTTEATTPTTAGSTTSTSTSTTSTSTTSTTSTSTTSTSTTSTSTTPTTAAPATTQAVPPLALIGLTVSPQGTNEAVVSFSTTNCATASYRYRDTESGISISDDYNPTGCRSNHRVVLGDDTPLLRSNTPWELTVDLADDEGQNLTETTTFRTNAIEISDAEATLDPDDSEQATVSWKANACGWMQLYYRSLPVNNNNYTIDQAPSSFPATSGCQRSFSLGLGTATPDLFANTDYTVDVTVVGPAGGSVTRTINFRTPRYDNIRNLSVSSTRTTATIRFSSELCGTAEVRYTEIGGGASPDSGVGEPIGTGCRTDHLITIGSTDPLLPDTPYELEVQFENLGGTDGETETVTTTTKN